MPNLERDEVVDERWKRRFIWQLHVFTKEIGFCESFLHVCRLNPNAALACENVVNLLRKPPSNTLEENQTWTKALGEAQFELMESHRSAFIVAAEFTSTSVSKRAMRWMRYLRMTIARKFTTLQE
ncbi:hypothetical protein ACE15N_22645 (plasmid) [Xanthomonas campestris pv. passiflorae]